MLFIADKMSWMFWFPRKYRLISATKTIWNILDSISSIHENTPNKANTVKGTRNYRLQLELKDIFGSKLLLVVYSRFSIALLFWLCRLMPLTVSRAFFVIVVICFVSFGESERQTQQHDYIYHALRSEKKSRCVSPDRSHEIGVK